ncbi:FAD-binding protein [Nocardioides sp. HDW12B]|uniref:FAD-binding protein n=1 Tax=Nocardioides sp. HDW12B TaxID=2714939 RepID=UPI00140BF55B|nr:FAD-binding protein [Nocardioides sp. HDW12B]QIK67603.1 FAD-binding protein [Nocardioides sp. HDW12B]
MSVEIPAPAPAASVASWSDDVDVLVVGAGMAGTCAAVEAARAGARVLLLDRGGPGTSTSAMSGGDFYLGGGTAVQQATGHDDSAEEMEKYLRAASPEADPEKIRLYCQESVDHFDWLEGLGFEFERSYYAPKAVVQPGTEGLMYTGSEKAHPFCELARPAPRGHKPPFVGDVGGGGFVVERALAECARLGVEVRYDTGVTALVVDGGPGAAVGPVVGATWKRYAETGAVRAGAVVVAAGGFVMNDEMIAAYAPRLQALVARGMALGNSFDDGLGIRLGESVGGVAEHMEGAFFTSPFYPPGETLKGIVVNNAGERFVNEDGYHSRTAAALFEQPGAEGYLILDSATMVEPAYGFQPLVDGWETVEEMEAGLGMPEGALVATMRDYDKHAAEGHDPAFHKAAEWLVPLDQGPWGAYDLTPGKAFYAGFTMGGLKVSVDGEVLRPDGSPVPGVYAAGAAAANIALDGSGYSSGTQLGEASYFGRRAGRHAAGA